MKLAIMQPYFFPYIGYFQLVGAVDKFIFYDDVNFIKRGWINRTNILTREGKQLLSISLMKSSQNKLINEIELIPDQNKLLKTIEFTYKKAPFYNDVFPMVESCLNCSAKSISAFAANTISSVADYLNLGTEFELSSDFHSTSAGYEKARRLMDICRKENADVYINSIGGKEIYFKENFQRNGIDLYFLESKPIIYSQAPIRKDTFEPKLSIIDVLMFNDPEKVKQFLGEYELI
jgi:hypothetical protein